MIYGPPNRLRHGPNRIRLLDRRGLPIPWIGQKVFCKPDAKAKVGNQLVKIELLTFPSEVEAVNGDWLWLGRAWVRKHDVMLHSKPWIITQIRFKQLTLRKLAIGRNVGWYGTQEASSKRHAKIIARQSRSIPSTHSPTTLWLGCRPRAPMSIFVTEKMLWQMRQRHAR